MCVYQKTEMQNIDVETDGIEATNKSTVIDGDFNTSFTMKHIIIRKPTRV